jgi:uncharacterized protein YggL (DUF469 family)
MKKRLRKKLRVGEFQQFSFTATLRLRSDEPWDRFCLIMADFMSRRWRHWSFGYAAVSGERSFGINVGTKNEAETRRMATIRWLEGRDDVQLISTRPVDYKVWQLPRSVRSRRRGKYHMEKNACARSRSSSGEASCLGSTVTPPEQPC